MCSATPEAARSRSAAAKTTTGTGAAAKSTTYVYDPFDRTVSQTADGKTTLFTYLGMDNQVLREEIAGKADKSYQYAPWGQQLTQIKHKDDGSREYSQYIYRPRGDVQGITKEDGKTRATYGYTAYGKDDSSQFTGVDKPGASTEPYNSFRFNASRWDASSGTYDMGFRNYDPGLNRFLTRDLYGGALADMSLATDPFTGNRYAFAGGNPISFVELDGHLFGMSWSDIGHATLDVVGLVPVVGEVADVANGVWYAAEGNYVDAALSMASAIPLAGYAATAGKAVRYGDKALDAIDAGNDVRRAADNVPTRVPDTPSAPKVDTPDTPSVPKANTPDTPSVPTRCNSFVPGTKVLLANGDSKAIEELQVGDEVMATDVESDENQSREVTNVRSHGGAKTLVTITVDVDGKAGSKTGKITSTAEHLIWLPDAGVWVTGAQLKVGMWLQTSAGTWVQITAVERHKRHERVHNLTVEGVHTYYVLAGDSPVLVHNCDIITKRLQEHVDNAVRQFESGALDFTTRQKRALRKAGKANDVSRYNTLYGAFRGQRIDKAVKKAVNDDSRLNGILYVTRSGEVGPDFHDVMTNRWWDVTTRAKWKDHTGSYNKPFGIGTPLFTD